MCKSAAPHFYTKDEVHNTWAGQATPSELWTAISGNAKRNQQPIVCQEKLIINRFRTGVLRLYGNVVTDELCYIHQPYMLQ